MFHLIFKVKRIVKLGMRSIVEHKLRSFLTALGIIFGVGSVIGMLSIGEGASYEARQQIRSLGSNNIIIRSVKPAEQERAAGTDVRSMLVEYGIKYEDMMRIRDLFPTVEIHIPAREINAQMRFRDVNVNGKIIGTVPWALKQSQLTITDGRFIDQRDLDEDANVVVLSKAAAAALFVLEYPIGKNIYLGTQSYHVIGIVSVPGNPGAEDGAGAKEIYDVYIPITAARTRFGEVMLNMDRGAASLEKVELHQLTLSTPSEDSVIPIAEAVRETMRHTHRRTDYEITVPLELLKQAEQTKRIFNIVLGSIAAISLLVGGIGIMNIMLASVTERTREIGIRRALGATRSDIVVQFLTEALLLSLFGGIIGIGLGVGVPMIVTHFAGLVTIVQPDSILLAFSISLLTGIIFGIYPAIRAAALSPIEALRHE